MGRLDDLTITEFTELALGYYLDFEDDTIISLIEDFELKDEGIEREILLDDLEVYNYLRQKTNGFERQAIWIALREMDNAYCDFLDTLWSYDKSRDDFDSDCFEWYDVARGLLKDEYEKRVGHRPILEPDDIPGQGEIDIQLPDALNTDEAKRVFQKAIEAGYMKEDYSFVGTRYQQAYFAEKMADYLNLKYKWKPFSMLWGYDKFSQVRRESKERFGLVPEQDKIDSLFQ